MKSWTLTRQLVVGFLALAAITLLTAVLAVYSVNEVAQMSGELIDYHSENLDDARRMEASIEQQAANFRAYLLTQDRVDLQHADEAYQEFLSIRTRLADRLRDEQSSKLLDQITKRDAEHERERESLEKAKASETTRQLSQRFDDEVLPAYRKLAEAVANFIDHEKKQLKARREATEANIDLVMRILGIVAAVAVVLAGFFAVWLTRRLATQVGTSIQDVRSSSTELEAAANEQAAGAREQSAAMNEISTTMTELLSTSRQITDSARRVADIAGETEQAANTGGAKVEQVAVAVSQIRTQVDRIVEHMLELGDKSQRIGAILALIDELSEQTNILAINATIEAAGAGESGRRFGVVAEEIRKLSDRVGGSTGEIRTLVNEIQEAVNTTVMATEGGAKAVDQGHERFAELRDAFREIAERVETTTEAAQEIELSTTQQTSAVEQVNAAINDAAQAAREAETATTQTLQTATQLAALSDDMSRLIESGEETSAS